ncbi:UNVERIFIED_CONTAM: hypothetical protein Sradi_6888400 [Sesamum radiatum]|uniref:Uncharacterized protein n=1 Tax=Sesamum radiatum TaxID=300843 RepID=A0AAW2JJI9_SESRA
MADVVCPRSNPPTFDPMSRLHCAANEVLRAIHGPPSPRATCSTTSQLAMWVCVCTDGATESNMTWVHQRLLSLDYAMSYYSRCLVQRPGPQQEHPAT